MTFPLFVQTLVNGLALGMLYVLVVIGFDLVLRVTSIFNFAHGEFYMVGAYAFYFAYGIFKLPFVLSLIFSVVAIALLGSISYVAISVITDAFCSGSCYDAG